MLGIEREVLDWIDVAEDRIKWGAVSNKVMNLWLASNTRKFLKI
jgi:hypothetical protein